MVGFPKSSYVYMHSLYILPYYGTAQFKPDIYMQICQAAHELAICKCMIQDHNSILDPLK